MSASPVVTRFAPSPTGMLHIGSARTALFNWLYARGRGGKFLLRIEDTDRARSTPEATKAILSGMTWLGLDWDGDPTSQYDNASRHAEVANKMLANGHAYKCFSTQEEIQAFRDAARAEKRTTLFRSPWRDTDPANHPDAPFVIRVKAPLTGETVVNDAVQGRVVWRNDQLDDMICLRSDGSPTYMLAVVVDDHDMGVTHVIRGDDHLANTPRQMLVYSAMGWDVPIWAHIPLLHGADGKKLSKRHGATGVVEYQALGYPASGMRNYLTRLGWSHGDDEFFTDAQALDWFDLDGIGKSPSRFDTKKLENICGQHIAITDDAALAQEITEYLAAVEKPALDARQIDGLLKAMYCLKERSKTLPQLIDKAWFILTERPLDFNDKAAKALDENGIFLLAELTPHLQNVSWSRTTLEEVVASVAGVNDIKLGKIVQPLRAALAGRAVTPSVFDMMLVLGREETLARLMDVQGISPQKT
ncbi:MAG: glutamate--tRNA ligase [Paracoccaceae bacterium]